MKVLSVINNDKDAVTKEYVDDKAGVTAVDPTSGPVETDFFIPTKTSELTNDSGFITEAALVTKQDTLVSGTNIKTINNTSLLGSGNISVATASDIPTKTSDLINDSGFITSSANKYSLTELKALTDPTDDLFLSLKADIINHNPMVITYSQNLNSSESISAEAVVLSATVETTQDFGEVYAISFRKDIITHPGIIHTLGFMPQGEQLEVVEILMIENEVATEAPEPTSNLTLSSLETGDIVGCGENMKIRYSESDEWATLEGINTGDIFIKNTSRGNNEPVGYIAAKTRDGWYWYMVYAAVYHNISGFFVSEFTYDGDNPINPIAYILKNSVRKDRLMEGANVSIEDGGSGWLRISANENESYGTCSSSGDASVKVVNIVRGYYLVESTVGNILRVRFDNALTCNNPTLRVGSGTSFDIYDRDTNNKLQSGAWGAGDIVTFYWDGSAVRAIAGLRATTTNYGETKLSSSVSSTSTTEAATSSAVRQAYNLANGKQDALVSGTNIKTINNQTLLGSGNITIEGAINELTSPVILNQLSDGYYRLPSGCVVYSMIGDSLYTIEKSALLSITNNVVSGNNITTYWIIEDDTSFEVNSDESVIDTISDPNVNIKYGVICEDTGDVVHYDKSLSDFITSETDPIFSASAAHGITSSNISTWNGKLDSSKVKNANSTTAGDVYDVRYINTMLGDIESLLGGI